MAKPLIAISMGDPAGIGPEVVARAAVQASLRAEMDLVVYGDPEVLAVAPGAGPVREVKRPEEARGVEPTTLPVIRVSTLRSVVWGSPTPASDRAQVEYVDRAASAVLAKEADALATAPISKASLHRAGAPWPGHTEMLAELCGVSRPVMMLAGPTLRAVPITTHIGLARVPEALTVERVRHAIEVTADALRRHFGCARPRVAVAALNPHAGEGGLFGDEEQRIIVPAMEAAWAAWFDLSGPHPPDTIFGRAARGEADAVLGMYHDQALIPVKLLDFDRAVNVTLGLPMIRTSVDHGTAYDIAGRGTAKATSMSAALSLAASMVQSSARG